MRRRDFIKALTASAAVWPVATNAQQLAMPVIGFLGAPTARGREQFVAAFREGLREAGFVEGYNVAIEYHWSEGHYERLPAMAADLVRRQVSVIAATSTQAALAAKAATTTIPIVFTTSGDPVELGLVTNLRRPGGNVTGVTSLILVVGSKRLELLHELVPNASVIAALVNPANPTLAEINSRELQAAARTLGLELHFLNASTEHDFDGAFAKLIQLRAGGLVIAPDPFYTSRNEQLAALTIRHAVPAIHFNREFAVAGGLLSYGGGSPDTYRLAGIYTGRVLRGDKPADLPVQQGTKLELYINLRTAKALGITVPQSVQSRADEVIE